MRGTNGAEAKDPPEPLDHLRSPTTKKAFKSEKKIRNTGKRTSGKESNRNTGTDKGVTTYSPGDEVNNKVNVVVMEPGTDKGRKPHSPEDNARKKNNSNSMANSTTEDLKDKVGTKGRTLHSPIEDTAAATTHWMPHGEISSPTPTAGEMGRPYKRHVHGSNNTHHWKSKGTSGRSCAANPTTISIDSYSCLKDAPTRSSANDRRAAHTDEQLCHRQFQLFRLLLHLCQQRGPHQLLCW